MSARGDGAVRPMAPNRTERTLAAIGVLSAGVIAVAVNVLAARHYVRWDWTTDELYTLSAATLDTLDRLREPVDVAVLLSRNDPFRPSIEQMLETYRTETPWLRTRFVDPDRNPAEFIALQRKYDIVAGRTQDGRVVTDAVVVVARGNRHWYITSDDLVAYEEDDSLARPQLERALTHGIRQVMHDDQSVVCFTVGHEEISIEDISPTGFSELARRLEKDNYEVRSVQLGSSTLPTLRECSLVVVAAPDVEIDSSSATRVADYLVGGGNVLVFASAALDEQYRVRHNGLQPIALAGGVRFDPSVVIEEDAERRLPGGFGETFFADPENHAITRGLFRRNQAELPVLVTLAHPLARTEGSTAEPLLVSGPDAFELRDLSGAMSGDPPKRSGHAGGPFTVAMAAELTSTAPGAPARGPRLVIVPASVGFSRNWSDPALIGTRRFAESAVSWLSSRPLMVTIPSKGSHSMGIALTEASLGEVWRYVLVYMPGSVVLLGILVLYRRRIGDGPPGSNGPRRRRKRRKQHRESTAAPDRRPS